VAKNLSNGLPISTKGKGIAFDLVAVALFWSFTVKRLTISKSKEERGIEVQIYRLASYRSTL